MEFGIAYILSIHEPFFCSIITDIWLLKPNLDLYQKNPKDLQPIFNPNQLHSCAEYVQFCSFSIQGHNRLLLEKVRVLGIYHTPQSKYYGLGKNHHWYCKSSNISGNQIKQIWRVYGNGQNYFPFPAISDAPYICHNYLSQMVNSSFR